MTAAEFRKLALSLRGAEEKQHMNHPDFRVGGRIFATMGYPDKSWAMVKLVPGQQEQFVDAEPEVYSPVKGKWGLQGATSVCLKKASKTSAKKALMAAWENQIALQNGRQGRDTKKKRR